jgi:hypothetical protein
MMTDERLITSDWKGNGRDVIEVLSLHLTEETEVNQETFNQNSLRPGLDLSREPPEYKSRMLSP